MNNRLPCLVLIAVGCATAFGSKLDLDHAEDQAKKILELCKSQPKPDFREFSKETGSASDTCAMTPVVSTNFPPEQSESPSEDSMADLAKKDPALAAQTAEALPPGYARLTAMNQVATVWADQDPAAALWWAKQLPDPDDRNTVTAAALFAWGQAEPQKAIAYAAASDLGDQTLATMGILVQKWAANDLPSAVTYVDQQPPGEMKDEMLSRIVPSIANTDPALAGQIVSDQMPPGPAQTEAAISVLHQWALKDPAGATAWVQNFPAGALKERALKEITSLADYRTR